jgi:hypothetical protein
VWDVYSNNVVCRLGIPERKDLKARKAVAQKLVDGDNFNAIPKHTTHYTPKHVKCPKSMGEQTRPCANRHWRTKQLHLPRILGSVLGKSRPLAQLAQFLGTTATPNSAASQPLANLEILVLSQSHEFTPKSSYSVVSITMGAAAAISLPIVV